MWVGFTRGNEDAPRLVNEGRRSDSTRTRGSGDPEGGGMMRRTELLQGLRRMNFEEVLGRTKRCQRRSKTGYVAAQKCAGLAR